ncbi:MAG: hypothetical protein EA428_04850 [Spirochaetaceae bacterium]|nr:MAG: hypothetical protein EA428_04850 [Spirochaetaceae bacterium]
MFARLFGAHSVLFLALMLLATVGANLTAQEGAMIVPIEVNVRDGRVGRRAMIDTRLGSDGRADAFWGDTLRPLLQGMTAPQVYAQLQDAEWLTLDLLSAAGLLVEYREAELSAEIRVPAPVQPVQNLSVRGTRTAPRDPRVEPSFFSIALPFYLSAQRVDLGGAFLDPDLTQNRFGIEALPSITLGGTVAAAKLNYSVQDDEFALDNWEAALSRDLAGTTRITAGTARIDALGFQTSQPIMGLGIERREGIGATPVLADRFQTSFEIETESVAAIYLNERLIRTSRLAPGSYELSEFPLLPGLNDVRVVITDVYGDERVIRGRVSHAPGLLPRGESEFGVLGGVVGDDYDILLGRAYYRRGILDALSGDMYGEASQDAQMLGLNFVGASRIGILELGAAGVYAGEANQEADQEADEWLNAVEYAVRAAYRLSTPNYRHLPSLGLTALYRSEGFYAPGTLPNQRPAIVPPWVLTATLNQSLPFGASLVLGSRYTVAAGDASDSASLFAYLAAQLSGNVSARAGLNINDLTGDTEVSGRLSIAVGLGRGSYRGTYHVTDEELDISTTQRFGGRSANGSLGVAVDRIDPQAGTARSAAANVRAANPRAEIAAAARVSPGESLLDNSPERSEARVRLGTGLYFANGVVGVGRPTTGSFAVIGKDRSLPRGPVLVNPSGDGAEARTGLLGGAVLSSIPDYYEKPVRIELPDLPIDYALDWSSVVAESGYRSGTGLRVTGARLLYGSGSLVDQDGAAVALRVIRIFNAEGLVLSSFTDESGRFVLYDLTPGEYVLRLGDSERSVEFSLAASEELPLDLGVLVLSELRGER